MRLNPGALICDCGRPPRAIGPRGSFTCDNLQCPNHGRVFIIQVTRKVEASSKPRREEYFGKTK